MSRHSSGVATPFETLVFEALSYRRHVGATLSELGTYCRVRLDKKVSPAIYRRALLKFESQGLVRLVERRWFLTSAGRKLARGAALAPEWESHDAWVLLSILYATQAGDAGISDIIACGDYINHAVLGLDELYGSLHRLLAARLISWKKARVRPTERAERLFAKVEASSSHYVLSQLDALRRILLCPCCGIALKRVSFRLPIDRATHRAAVGEYLGRARR